MVGKVDSCCGAKRGEGAPINPYRGIIVNTQNDWRSGAQVKESRAGEIEWSESTQQKTLVLMHELH